MSDRLDVRKTYKLLINGAFPRSESGRSYEVTSSKGEFLANVAQGSRKDVRDAVVAARAAQSKWWSLSAYNRGQVIYRLAEMAESRRDELVDFVKLSEGVKSEVAKVTVDKAIDKISQVLGGANPVAGPFYNFSVPKPSGVIAVIAPQDSSFEGFVETVIAPIAAGNAVVVLASEKRPIPAILLGEMTATSDFPAGVLNIITGITEEIASGLASHEDIDGIDLEGVSEPIADELSFLAAGSIKRVLRPKGKTPKNSIHRLRAFVETSTVWHTIGQ